MYRTKCTMYDEVSVGNPGKVPYCTKQDKLEPDCQHCKQPYATNADRIRAMTDEELAELFETIPHLGNPSTYTIDGFCLDDGLRTKRQWLDWLKQEAE